MATGWQSSKAQADRFTGQLKALLADAFITEASPHSDQNEATDLMVFTVTPYRVGCRIRAHKYWARYGDEFTVRSSRTSGAKTELTKILEGWGDFILYAFSDPTDTHIYAALLLDLTVFRASIAEHAKRERDTGTGTGFLRWSERPNRDGSSSFHSYDISSFPATLIRTRWANFDLSTFSRTRQLKVPLQSRA